METIHKGMDLSKPSSSRHHEVTVTPAYTSGVFMASLGSSGWRLRPQSQDHTRKEFHCSTCGYQAISESKLIMHIRRHTGEKPFVCHYCPYRSAQKSNLSTHLRNVHYSEIGKPFDK